MDVIKDFGKDIMENMVVLIIEKVIKDILLHHPLDFLELCFLLDSHSMKKENLQKDQIKRKEMVISN